MIVLESSRLRLTLDPGRGAQWSALEARREAGAGDWTSLVPDCREDAPRPRAGQDESVPLAAASFHMIPYSNRVRDGRFAFAGTVHELPEPGRHAIHGVVRKRPWRVAPAGAGSDGPGAGGGGPVDGGRARCTFESAEHEDVGWPWPIGCAVEHELDGSTLVATMSVTNRGDSPMPAGLGWHPYFVREVAGAGPTLTLPVDAVFPDADGDCLPDGPPVALPDALDFRAARALDPHRHIDRCLAGLDGAVRVEWPGTGFGLTMRADAVCRFLVLFNPAAPHFAVEPVTNANDAFNLAARGIDGGARTLAPGETLRATLRLELD